MKIGRWAALLLLFALPFGRAHGQTRDPLSDPGLALAALDRKITDLDAEEQASHTELASLDDRIRSVKDKVRSHAGTFYRATRSGQLPLGGGFVEFLRHAAFIERSRRALVAEVKSLREMRARTVALGGALERNRGDRLKLANQRTATDAARLAVDEEKSRQDAFDHAFQSAGRGDYVAVYGSTALDPAAGPSFASSKGRLVFPVLGRAEVRAAKRDEANGPAVEIRAALGSAVRAVFRGRVAFADRYGSYGRIVILDHGDHYYTVSGNLASIDVRVGDELSAGERIGTVGDEGQGAMLYFEIRKASQTIAPGPWLGF